MFAVCQLLRPQVFPVTHQQVEREKARLTPMKEQVTKLRSSTLIKADDFTIENGFSSKRQCHSLAKILERVEGISIAGDELCSTVLDNGEGAESVILQLENPLGVVEWRRSAR